MLGTELLESLLKMAPTNDEERKLKAFKDEPPFKLGSAEKFLKVMHEIPFAFKRVDAMLYIANFDSELEYLRKSYEILEVHIISHLNFVIHLLNVFFRISRNRVLSTFSERNSLRLIIVNVFHYNYDNYVGR